MKWASDIRIRIAHQAKPRRDKFKVHNKQTNRNHSNHRDPVISSKLQLNHKRKKREKSFVLALHRDRDRDRGREQDAETERVREKSGKPYAEKLKR